MNKYKVCILNNGLGRGGTDTFVVNTVNGINKEKFEITVVLSIDESSPKRLSIRENEVIKAGAKTIRTYSLNGIKGKVKHLLKLYKILKKGKYDVFHTNIDLFNGYNMLVAWFAGVPIRICHSHNSQQAKEVNKGKTLPIRIYQHIMKKLCWKFSNRRSGCSEAAMDFLFSDKWRNDSNSRIIYNGIELNKFRRTIDKENKKKELNLKNKYNILTVGRIDIQKNPHFIIDTFAKLCKIRDDCDLVWVGVGNMENEIKDKINKYGISERVHMLGSRGDVNEIMRACDIFLFPSLFEGFGIVAIEAQASELPCLISDTVPRGVNCGLCIFKSLKETTIEWAKTLNDMLNKRFNLSLDRVKLDRFSVECMVNQMEKIFS